MELEINTLLKDRYLIEKQLGKGGMGAVYLATDTAVDRKVAVKANLNPSSESKRQFEREARLLAKLRHPNLPLVTDHFILEDVQYLVMDYVPGEDLSNIIETEGAQPVDVILGWAKQIGDALTYLHSQMPAVIHRDIKPANIKITPEGKLTLVDFGIAKASETDATAVGARGYTPGYAPPEQYGATPTGRYSDQYSLAATLYTLLLGTPPAESIERILEQVTLASPRSVDRSIPKHIDSALKRGLSIEPDQRFASVDDFIKALTDPKFTPAKPPKPAATVRAKPKKKRSPLLIILSIAAVGCITVGAVIASMPGYLDLAAFIPSMASGDSPAVTDSPIVAVIPPTNTPEGPTATPTATPTNPSSPTPTLVGGGGLIAFTSNRDGTGFYQIFTMHPDGRNVTQLTFDLVHKSQPVWSPDGKKLIYVADAGRDENYKPLNLDIFVMNTDGTNPVNLTHTKGDDNDPAWSPDGTKIAFTSTRAGNVKQIFIMDADGSNVEYISEGYAVEYNPTWSPDGEWLAFGSSIFNTLSIRKSSMYGKAAELFDTKKRLGQVIQPVWSPDGEYIVYTRTQGATKEIFLAVFKDRGEQLLRLTYTSNNQEPSWSPDGNWIVFTSRRDLNYEIYTMDTGGRFETNITNHEAQDREASWQPLPGD